MIEVYWLYKEDTDLILKDGYVGVTRSRAKRFCRHRKRFGEFKFKIIFKGSMEEALELERFLRPYPGIGWNEAVGGANGYKAAKSEATKEKLRLSNLGQKRSAEVIANMKAAKQNISEETKRKIGLAALGRKHTDEAKAKVVAALIGRKVSEETKAKISASLKGKEYSVERRANMSKGKWDKRNFEFDISKMIVLNTNHCSVETIACLDAEVETMENK